MRLFLSIKGRELLRYQGEALFPISFASTTQPELPADAYSQQSSDSLSLSLSLFPSRWRDDETGVRSDPFLKSKNPDAIYQHALWMSTLTGLHVHPRADSFRCPTDTWRGYVKLCAIRNVNVSREDSWPTIPRWKLGELDDVLCATRRFHRRGLLICLLSFDQRPRLYSTSLSSRLCDTGNTALFASFFFSSRAQKSLV